MKDPVEIITPTLAATTNGSNGSAKHYDSDVSDTIPTKYSNGVTGLGVHSNVADSMRSSSSSLSQDTPVSALKSGLKSSSVTPGSKKVSITEPVSLAVVKREHAVSPLSEKTSHRHSIINISADKRARKVKFFINGDKFFKGAVIAVNNEKFRTFDKLLEHMTKIMCNQVTLPNGVRYIFSLEGKNVVDMDCILNGESYVCSSGSSFKKLDYVSLAGESSHRNKVETNLTNLASQQLLMFGVSSPVAKYRLSENV